MALDGSRMQPCRQGGIRRIRGTLAPHRPTQTILTNLSPDFSKPKYHGGQPSQSLGNIECANLIEVWFDLVDFPLIRWCPRRDGISTLGERLVRIV